MKIMAIDEINKSPHEVDVQNVEHIATLGDYPTVTIQYGTVKKVGHMIITVSNVVNNKVVNTFTCLDSLRSIPERKKREELIENFIQFSKDKTLKNYPEVTLYLNN